MYVIFNDILYFGHFPKKMLVTKNYIINLIIKVSIDYCV